MKATDLLLNRQSNGLLTEPAPDEASLDFILQAGMRVPDHAGLTPWHFTIVQGNGLDKLGQIFANIVEKEGGDEAQIEKAKTRPHRAPMIIIISTRYQSHEKVPHVEQLITAGCCAHAMQLAAFSLGYGAMWRTGDITYKTDVKEALAVSEDNDIVGFLYIGSNQKTMPKKPRKHYSEFVSYL